MYSGVHKAKIIVLVLMAGSASPASSQRLLASYYWEGRGTASGERFNPNGLTAAHRSWPFGTRLRVTYRGKSIVVRINDRGPWKAKHSYEPERRSLDLSLGAARALGMSGVKFVEVERLR